MRPSPSRNCRGGKGIRESSDGRRSGKLSEEVGGRGYDIVTLAPATTDMQHQMRRSAILWRRLLTLLNNTKAVQMKLIKYSRYSR